MRSWTTAFRIEEQESAVATATVARDPQRTFTLIVSLSPARQGTRAALTLWACLIESHPSVSKRDQELRVGVSGPHQAMFRMMPG
jgi:hypothetical protein